MKQCFVTKQWLTPQLVSTYPSLLFVFGDNTLRVGKGGQAIIRDLPNAFGICTKWSPGIWERDFFSDEDETAAMHIEEDINLLKALLNHDPLVAGIVFPSQGIGTGLSAMPEKCPKLFQYLNERLWQEFGFDNTGEMVYLPLLGEKQ